MNLVIGIIITIAIWIGILATLIILARHQPQQVAKNAVKFGGMAITILSCCAVFLMLMIYGRSYTHGNRDVWMPFSTMEDYVKQTPTESKLPGTLQDVAIIYYRFDCGDCHAVFEDLNNIFGNRRDVYFICTRSEQGKEIRKTYEVPEVPYAVFIPKDPTQQPEKLVMYEKQGDQIVLHSDNTNRLITLLEQKNQPIEEETEEQ